MLALNAGSANRVQDRSPEARAASAALIASGEAQKLFFEELAG